MKRGVLVMMLTGCSFSARMAPAVGDAAGSSTSAGADAAGDTAGVDAPPPVPITGCPSNYTLQVASSASWYRVETSGVWWDVRRNCEQDQPGRTHLVVLDTTAEQVEVTALVSNLSPPPGGMWHVGAVQDMNQAVPASGWHWLTGGPVAATGWSIGEPDDGNGTETNKCNLAVLDPGSGLLMDVDSLSSNPPDAGALCECDGQPISSAVAGQIPPDNS